MMSANALTLSLNDAVSRILENSHDIKRANANIDAADAGLSAANANRWFKVNATGTYMNTVNVENPNADAAFIFPGGAGLPPFEFIIPDNIFMAGVNLSQPIYTFGKIGYAVDGMKDAVKIAGISRDITMREVRFAANQLYWTAKMTDEIAKISSDVLDARKSARKKLKAAGYASNTNLVRIDADIAAAEIALSDAKFNRDTAFNILKIMAGINESDELILSDDFPDEFVSIDISELESNLEWDLYQKQIDMYEARAKSARAGGNPTIALTAGYNYITAGSTAGGLFEQSGSQSANWGVSVSVPVFAGGLYRAQSASEYANANAARADLENSKQQKAHEFDTATRKYNYLCENLGQLKSARDLANKSLKISTNRFANGQTNAIELSDATNAAMQMDMALLNAKFNIVMASETIKKLGQ